MGHKYKGGKKEQNTKYEAPKKEFVFPENVRQIGELHEGVKIYIEDYAYSFINKRSVKKGYDDKAFFLIGYKTSILTEEVIVIEGAVYPPNFRLTKDGQAFTEEDISYGKDILKKHFDGLSIVGWARVQPGYGLYLSGSDITNHRNFFGGKNDLLFLSDPEEKIDCFFSWNETREDVIEVPGYFVYYDRNPGMNSYMAENRDDEGKKVESTDGELHVYDDDMTITFATAALDSDNYDDFDELDDDSEKHGLLKSVENARRIAAISRQKRLISMMTTVSTLLFFACVIMGIGLLQNGEKIADIESEIKDVKSGYTNLVSRLNDNVYPTFAAQNDADIQDTGDIAANIETGRNEDTVRVTDEINAAVVRSATQSDVTITTVKEAEAEKIAEDNTEKAEPESVSLNTYIVKNGDTLSSISQKFYGSTTKIDAIMDANGLLDRNVLKVGKVLIIPE